jgi:hypothetical protein
MLTFGVTIPATVPQRSEIPEGLMNYPVYLDSLLVKEANYSGVAFRKRVGYTAHKQQDSLETKRNIRMLIIVMMHI